MISKDANFVTKDFTSRIAPIMKEVLGSEEFDDSDSTLVDFINFAMCSCREIMKETRTYE
jgi:hypothetical protein